MNALIRLSIPLILMAVHGSALLLDPKAEFKRVLIPYKN